MNNFTISYFVDQNTLFRNTSFSNRQNFSPNVLPQMVRYLYSSTIYTKLLFTSWLWLTARFYFKPSIHPNPALKITFIVLTTLYFTTPQHILKYSKYIYSNMYKFREVVIIFNHRILTQGWEWNSNLSDIEIPFHWEKSREIMNTLHWRPL